MKKILTAIVSVSIFIVGILLILCADTNFLWYAFNQNVRLTVVAGILIAWSQPREIIFKLTTQQKLGTLQEFIIEGEYPAL